MALDEAIPSDLIGFAAWAQQRDRELQALAGRINGAIEGFNATPQNPRYIGPLPYVGDELALLSAGMAAVDEWVGDVGRAFEQAGNQGMAPNAGNGWTSMHDATLSALVTGPVGPSSPTPSAAPHSPPASSGASGHNGRDGKPAPPKPPTGAQWYDWGLGLTLFVIGAGLTVVSGGYFLAANAGASSASDIPGILESGDAFKGGGMYGVSSLGLMAIGLYLMTPVNDYSSYWYETNAPNMPENPGA